MAPWVVQRLLDKAEREGRSPLEVMAEIPQGAPRQLAQCGHTAASVYRLVWGMDPDTGIETYRTFCPKCAASVMVQYRGVGMEIADEDAGE